jgi:hypothetical protein
VISDVLIGRDFAPHPIRPVQPEHTYQVFDPLAQFVFSFWFIVWLGATGPLTSGKSMSAFDPKRTFALLADLDPLRRSRSSYGFFPQLI